MSICLWLEVRPGKRYSNQGTESHRLSQTKRCFCKICLNIANCETALTESPVVFKSADMRAWAKRHSARRSPIRDELWQSEFDRVLFIDLRIAKHFSSAYEFLKMEFAVSFWAKDWFIEIMKVLSDHGDTRTLVVFDGLEELSEDQCESWDKCLYRENVIVTCRPHVLFKWKRLPFDLDVQVTGFHDDVVSSYLNKMVPDAQALRSTR